MLLPKKHIRLSESIFGLSAFLISELATPKSVDDLTAYLDTLYRRGKYPVKHSFENTILAMCYLYMIGAIEVDEEGKVYRADHTA